MANHNLDQDVANKRERQWTSAQLEAKSYPLQQAVRMCRYVSLININPSAFTQVMHLLDLPRNIERG